MADGGSRDATVKLARAFGDRGIRVVRCERRGRGPQMNAGAAAARGAILVFLHADVRLPGGALGRIQEALREPGVVAGAFLTRTVRENGQGAFEGLLRLADLRSRHTRLPYGDQALFVRAEIFRALGGYAEIPLMEDLEFALRLRKAGRIVRLPEAVEVSGRRFQARPIRSVVGMNLFPVLFRLGVSPRLLARLYGDPR